MVQKKIEIKICFIYQDIHIYLKYFNLICKIIKFINLEPTITKRAYIYMLYTVTSKMSSRQFDLNLTSIRWIWRQFLYGSFDVLWGTHLTSNTWLYVIIQIIRVICAPRGGVGGRGLGMLFFSDVNSTLIDVNWVKLTSPHYWRNCHEREGATPIGDFFFPFFRKWGLPSPYKKISNYPFLG